MAEAILVDVAKSLVLGVASYATQQVLLAWGLKTQLKKLQRTMATITALLEESEEKPGTNTRPTDQVWLDKLREAVYEADDVFDEIRTRAERKKLMGGNTFTKEVKFFCSTSNQLSTSLILGRRIKSIRKTLAEISGDRRDFGNSMHPTVTVVENENNIQRLGSSCDDVVYIPDKVVGREKETNEIISMLFDSCLKEIVSVIPIVGIGGLGKTALVQHVYNNEHVKQNFDVQLWVSVPLGFKLKDIMAKIVVASGQDPSNCDSQQLKNRMSAYINGKKYMLILDGVWDENPPEWQDLKMLLTLGAAPGSKILVTTRSLLVGEIMGTIPSYPLGPLREVDSWNLFEKIAFHGKGCHEPSLREIGQDVLKICKNVPLAIRALAGVLAMTDFSSWSSFKNHELPNLASYGEKFDVMAVLKLSYDHLKPTKLKSCFSYCSLFPRGHVFDKQMLARLWITQGYVDPLYKSQCLEVAGESYIATLLSRSLLQNVEGDESANSCKLHDLMYDLSCSVTGGQCKNLSSMESKNSRESIRHICIDYQVDSSWKVSEYLQSIKQLRTFLFTNTPTFGTYMRRSVCDDLLSSFGCLRALALCNLGIKKLPKSIGKLIHLRYLDLSNNNFKELPNSLTLLHNLQYLNLDGCEELCGIPKDMKNLVNLRHLQISDSIPRTCYPYFPSGIGNLTKLQTLSVFVVPWVPVTKRIFGNTCARLGELSSLNSLEGELAIFIGGSYRNMALDAAKANLKGKTNLKSLRLEWSRFDYYEEDEMVIENLQPHNQISKLKIRAYWGVKLPTWMGTNQLASSLSHLTHIEIEHCANIQHIPSFSQLLNLKSIRFAFLKGVEYLESSSVDELEEASSSSSRSHCPILYFPSLTSIKICGLRNLKSWARYGVGDLLFPSVSVAKIHDCEKLEAMPWCPNAKKMSLIGVAKNLKMWRAGDTDASSKPKLKILEIRDVDYPVSLPRQCLQKVSQLIFKSENDKLDLIRLGEGLEGTTSLRTLKFINCPGLKSLSGMPLQLNTLERLDFCNCNEIKWSGDDDHTINAWKVLKSLRFLTFDTMPLLDALPQGIQYITTLQSLELTYCQRLTKIPDWIGELHSLSRLEIYECTEIASLPQEMRKLTNLKVFVVERCPKLADRCQRDTGEDWHKIPETANVSIWR